MPLEGNDHSSKEKALITSGALEMLTGEMQLTIQVIQGSYLAVPIGWLAEHVILVSDNGSMRVSTRDEVREIIFQHFGIRKDQFYVTRSSHEPSIVYFHETHARDVVFAARRVVEGPVELGVHAWDLDR
jgi:hypothetical protein